MAQEGHTYLAFESEEDVVRHALDHELGHKLLYQYKMKGEAEKLLTTAFREIDTVIGNYASTNADELFAECFAMYMGKGRLRMNETKAMIEKMVEMVNVSGGKQGNFNWTSRRAAKEGQAIYGSYDSTVKVKKELVANTQNVKAMLGDETKKIGGDFFFGDAGKPNLHGGNKNCVNVCFANELRRRGINVTATNAFVKDIAEDKYNELFRTKKGFIPDFTNITGSNETAVYNKLKKELKPNCRYILGGNDPDKAKLYRLGEISKDELDGHVVVAEVTPHGVVAYDHQIDDYVSLRSMINEIDLTDGIQVLRIDNLAIVEDEELIKKLVQVIY